MDHDPVQFLFKILSEFRCILFHPLHADKYIAGDSPGLLLVWESENIGEQIVLKVCFVQFQEIPVAAKYEINVPGFILFLADDKIQPLADSCLILQGKRNALAEKLDRKTHFPAFYASDFCLLK